MEKMNLERGDPVAKQERKLPALAFWITEDVDKTAANLRSRQTTKITLQPSEKDY